MADDLQKDIVDESLDVTLEASNELPEEEADTLGGGSVTEDALSEDENAEIGEGAIEDLEQQTARIGKELGQIDTQLNNLEEPAVPSAAPTPVAKPLASPEGANLAELKASVATGGAPAGGAKEPEELEGLYDPLDLHKQRPTNLVPRPVTQPVPSAPKPGLGTHLPPTGLQQAQPTPQATAQASAPAQTFFTNVQKEVQTNQQETPAPASTVLQPTPAPQENPFAPTTESTPHVVQHDTPSMSIQAPPGTPGTGIPADVLGFTSSAPEQQVESIPTPPTLGALQNVNTPPTPQPTETPAPEIKDLPTPQNISNLEGMSNTPVEGVVFDKPIVPPDQEEPVTTPAPAPVKPKVPTSLRPVRTFQDDIAQTVSHRQTSVVDIVSAEQQRKNVEPPREPKRSLATDLASYAKVGLSGLLIGAGLAGVAFFVLSYTDTPSVLPVATIPEYIFSEAQIPIDFTDIQDRRDLMNELIQRKESVDLNVGEVANLYLTETTLLPNGDQQARLISTTDFFSRIDIRASDSLARSLNEFMMFGVHVSLTNEPFLIFKTSFYERAFAEMFDWEHDMNADLAPLFGPIQLALQRNAGNATTTTDDLFGNPFEDEIIRNKEVHALKDDTGKIVLLYSFIDQNTLVITTNEITFAEVVTRMQSRRN